MGSWLEERSAIFITGLIGLCSTFLAYLLGRRQEMEKIRIATAFPKAEELAILIQDLHHTEGALRKWYEENFTPQLSLEDAVERIEQKAMFAEERKLINNLTSKRNELRDKIRASRVYLQASDLDRLETYLSVAGFSFQHDGMGGVFFTNFYRQYFASLLDDGKWKRREKLFRKIERRLSKMHGV